MSGSSRSRADSNARRLGTRQGSQHFRRGVAEEVAEHQVGEHPFSLCWTRDQDPEGSFARGGDAGQPKRGLPDAGFTLQHERSEAFGRSIEERLDDGKLGVPPDDLAGHEAMFALVRGRVHPEHAPVSHVGAEQELPMQSDMPSAPSVAAKSHRR